MFALAENFTLEKQDDLFLCAKEHEADFKHAHFTNGMVSHCFTCAGHRPDFTSFTTLQSERNLRKRKIKETVFFKANSDVTVNGPDSITLSETWSRFLPQFELELD